VRPEALSVQRFTEIDFDEAEAPRYQPIPGEPHPDLYQRHFHDPLYEFQSFILIAEVIENHLWAMAELVLLEREGQLWGVGDAMESCDTTPWLELPQILFCDDGSILLTEP